jgi:hypothetical protein
VIVKLSSTGAVVAKIFASGSGIAAIACSSSTVCPIGLANRGLGEWVQLLDNGTLGARQWFPAGMGVQAMACYQAALCYALAFHSSGKANNAPIVYSVVPVNPETGVPGRPVLIGARFRRDNITCAGPTECLVGGFTGVGSLGVSAAAVVSPGKPVKIRRYPTVESIAALACATPAACYAVGLGTRGAAVVPV